MTIYFLPYSFTSLRIPSPPPWVIPFSLRRSEAAMPGLTDTAAGYRLWRLLWVSSQALLGLPGWSGRATTGSSALEAFCSQGFNLCEYWRIWNHKHDVKPEAAQLGGFSVNFSLVWQGTFVLLHLLCDLDLHQQSQKPQRRKISKWIICCLSNYTSGCSKIHDLSLIYTFVWAHRAFFLTLLAIIASLSSLQLPSFRNCVRKQ